MGLKFWGKKIKVCAYVFTLIELIFKQNLVIVTHLDHQVLLVTILLVSAIVMKMLLASIVINVLVNITISPIVQVSTFWNKFHVSNSIFWLIFVPTSDCNCDPQGSIDNFCDPISGHCLCNSTSIGGVFCDTCIDGFYEFPYCEGQ